MTTWANFGQNFRQWGEGPSWALPFPRQFKTIRGNLRQYVTIWADLGQFKTMDSRPIVGVAFPQAI